MNSAALAVLALWGLARRHSSRVASTVSSMYFMALVTAPNYAEVSVLFFGAVHDVLTGAEEADAALALLAGELVAFAVLRRFGGRLLLRCLVVIA